MASNFTTETNFHGQHTIEELRRLFNERGGNAITTDKLNELINQCFNYELVSGKGIKITELKNTNSVGNSVKTYKIEGTGSSESGGGGGVIDVTKGIEFDKDLDNTIRISLYDYEESGDPTVNDKIYPVSLSEDGKLIVDTSTVSCTSYAYCKINGKDEYDTKSQIYEYGSSINNPFKFEVKTNGILKSVTITKNWGNEREITINDTENLEKLKNGEYYLPLNVEDSKPLSDNTDGACLKRTCTIKSIYRKYESSYDIESNTAIISIIFVFPTFFNWLDMKDISKFPQIPRFNAVNFDDETGKPLILINNDVCIDDENRTILSFDNCAKSDTKKVLLPTKKGILNYNEVSTCDYTPLSYVFMYPKAYGELLPDVGIKVKIGIHEFENNNSDSYFQAIEVPISGFGYAQDKQITYYLYQRKVSALVDVQQVTIS